MLRELTLKNRSYRRFHQDAAVPRETLVELVELARYSATGGNLQPLKFMLSWEPERNGKIFRHLAWAGYLKDWPGPEEGERPAAYIVILGDTRIRKEFGCDQGIAAQSILLGAVEKGLGGCMLGAVARPQLRESLTIPGEYEILLVLALGTPKEAVQIEAVGPTGDIKYWRDAKGVHHVPKRALAELIVP